MKKLLLAWAATVLVAVPVCLAVRAQSKVVVGVTLAATALELDVPHSSWLARCTALPVAAVEGLEVIKATVYAGRVTAILRKDRRVGFLQCHRLGVYSGAPVYACWGPTVLRDRMAIDPNCTHAIPWSAVKDLALAVKTWIAERNTCCGVATIGGEVRSEWPCRWELEPGRVTVTSRTGYGPGVVGSDQPCE